jgi:hypothetical protein
MNKVDHELPISEVPLTEVRRLREENDHLRSLLIANGIQISVAPPKKPMISTTPPALIADLHQLIAEARQSFAAAVNAGLTLLYWRIGKRIVNEVFGQERAAYGQQIVVSLARQLVDEHGPSFGEKNLPRMMQFAAVFPEEEIVVSLIRQLSWTHFIALLPIKTCFNGTSTRNSAAQKVGASADCGRRSTPCSLSAQPYLESLKNRSVKSLKPYGPMTNGSLTWFFAILTFWTCSSSPIA